MFETIKKYFLLSRGPKEKRLPSYSVVLQEEQDLVSGQSVDLASREEGPFHTAGCICLGFAILIAVLGVGTGVVVILLTYRPQQEAFKTDQGAYSTPILPSIPSNERVVFQPDLVYWNMTNLDSGNAWASLGRNGSIMVKHPEWYGLLPGIENDDGYEVFPVSVFHQLHCLRILREGYVALLGGKQRHDHIASHQNHCFDYLRQAIICSADLTLEKARVDEDGHRRATDGWGTEHRCKKWSEVEKVKLEYQWKYAF